jgi:hypothetical protein
MTATENNLKKLEELGFTKINSKKYVFKDLVAYLPLEGEYISFKYGKERLPIIDNIKSVEKIIHGIYEYMFEQEN